MKNQVYAKVLETIKSYDMLKKGDRVLIGVSGGPDSIFLLEALYNLRDRLGIEVLAANLDHNVRGRASHQDSRFVIEKAKGLGVRCIHKKLSPAIRESKNKLSLEEILRQKRYEFFKGAALRSGANVIATGHTMDDQAETVLMRVVKGSTIKGLTGIQPVSEINGLRTIRPLIGLEKKEILAYLAENGISFRTDRTNLDERYLRNAMRRSILPYLAKYNPQIKRSLTLMADSLREDREFIDEALKERRGLIRKNNRNVTIKLKDILLQPKSLQREMLRDAIVRTGASVKRLTYRHWKDADFFLKFNRKGQSISLPDGITMAKDDLNLIFRKGGKQI